VAGVAAWGRSSSLPLRRAGLTMAKGARCVCASSASWVFYVTSGQARRALLDLLLSLPHSSSSTRKLAHQSRETMSVATLMRRGVLRIQRSSWGFKIRGVFTQEHRDLDLSRERTRDVKVADKVMQNSR